MEASITAGIPSAFMVTITGPEGAAGAWAASSTTATCVSWFSS